MTYEEALEIMENEKQCVIRAENCNRDCAKCDLLKPAPQILEAYNITKESLEKQISKKPTEICEFGDNDLVGLCPFCYEGVNNEMYYCSNCSQALDWSIDNDL